jgi:nitroreductase
MGVLAAYSFRCRRPRPGSCWVGAFDEDKAAKAVHAPAALRPVAIVPIGHPAEHPTRPSRRLLQDLVHREKAT